MIDEQLTAFIQEGLPIHLATRNERLEPHGTRVTAVKVDEDREHLIAYLPKVSAAPILADLEANRQVALCFARPTDERACQVKGLYVESRAASARERTFALEQWERCLCVLEMVGYPRSATNKWKIWPCLAVRIRATALFNQTPGPGAGAPVP